MPTRKRTSAATAPGNGGRSRSPKGVPPDVLARLVNQRSKGVRRYLDPQTGKTYSERTVANTRAGGQSKEARQFSGRVLRSLGKAPSTQTRDYETLLRDYQQAEFLRTGKKPTLRKLRSASTKEGQAFLSTVRDLSGRNKQKKKRALERLGYRPTGAKYALGDSPKQVSFAEFRNSPFYVPNYRPDPKRRRAGEPKRATKRGGKRDTKRGRITGRN